MTYEMMGVEVGRTCAAIVLGVGQKRLARAMNGSLDMRLSQTGGGVRLCPKSATVDKFLFDLHGSIAETLRTEFLRCMLLVGHISSGVVSL